MWDLWLTRIGIILNFFAAFLIAPDVLGQRRLEAWQQALDRLVGRALAALQRGFGELIPPALDRRGAVRGVMVYSALVALSSGSFYYGIHTAVESHKRWGWGLAGGAYLACLLLVLLDGNSDEGLVFLLVLTTVVAGIGWFSCLFVVVFGIYLAVDSIAERLRGEGKIRAALLPLGVATFILGTLLQFIATFL